MAAPAATQRSCWRSTPREARNRRITQSRAAGREATWRARPEATRPLATSPRRPGWPSGLSKGTAVSVDDPGIRKAPTTNMAGPATAAAATTRQRRDRSRPSGTSRAGRVTPRAMAGAQTVTSAMALSLAISGSGRWSRASWSIQGPRGMIRLQVSAEAAYSQPIGLAGRRRVRTRPTVANPSGKPKANRAPSSEDLGGEWPRDQQRDHQPGGAAAHGGQPQRPGEQGPGPRLQRSSHPRRSGPVPPRILQSPGTGALRPSPQSSSAIRLAARVAPSVSTGR